MQQAIVVIISVPLIEKEERQRPAVVFGIRKREVIVDLEETGTCASLGMEPMG